MSDEILRIPIWLGDNLPSFKYSKKITLTSLFEKQDETETHRLCLTWYNKIPTHPEEQHLPFKQTGTTIIFHTDTNPVFGHVLIHSFNKAHVLVVTMELIWLLLLNILSFNFVLTPNKFLSGGPDSEEAM